MDIDVISKFDGLQCLYTDIDVVSKFDGLQCLYTDIDVEVSFMVFSVYIRMLM